MDMDHELKLDTLGTRLALLDLHFAAMLRRAGVPEDEISAFVDSSIEAYARNAEMRKHQERDAYVHFTLFAGQWHFRDGGLLEPVRAYYA